MLITVQRDATQSSLFIILKFTLHVSGVNHTHLATLEGGSCTNIWPVPKAVVTVMCTPDNGFNLATLEGDSYTKNMTITGGCSYSFVYSW